MPKCSSTSSQDYYTCKIYCTQKQGRPDLGAEKFLKLIKQIVASKSFIITETKVQRDTLNNIDEVSFYIEKPARKGLLGI